MKKFLTLALTLCLLVGVLAGCGGKDPAPQTPEPAASTPAASEPVAEPSGDGLSAQDVTGDISISWWGGDSRHDATQKALEAFEEEYPNIKIGTTNYGAWTGWEDSMSTAFYAGSAPDVNQVNWNWIFNYDANGTTFTDLYTLSDYIDLSQFNEAALKQCEVDGRLSAIPVSMTGRIFYWNETAFEAAGISVPTTKDELFAAGETFKTELGDDYYPMVMGEYDRMIFMVWALECQYGKNWVENGKLNYSQEEIEEGLQLLLDMEEAHVIPTIQKLTGDGAESLDKNPKWMDGKYGGIFEWDSAASKFESALNEGQSFAVGNYLTGFGDYKGGFTKVSLGFAISQTCDTPEAAAVLINFLLNEPEGARLMGSERGIPLSKAGLEVCLAEGLLNETVAEANQRVLAWCEYDLDPNFENAALKNTDGVYYDVMAGLSYGDFDTAEAAEILMDGIDGVLAGN